MSRKSFGKGREDIPDVAFNMMSWIFRIRDFFVNPAKKVNMLDIEEGMTVVDYGCGPGSYVKQASELVGSSGKLIAVDVQMLAVDSVKKIIAKHGLQNVEVVHAEGYGAGIAIESIDLLYAFDMFHMIEEPGRFLRSLAEILKAGGRVYLEDGHQSRKEAREKIEKSGAFTIAEEDQRGMWLQKIA